MLNHVGDTWQAMCHNAGQRPMHVGHMASHVSTCITHGEGYTLFIQEGSSKKKKEGKKRRRVKERKERE